MFRLLPRTLAFLLVLIVVCLALAITGCLHVLPTSSVLSAASGATHMCDIVLRRVSAR